MRIHEVKNDIRIIERFLWWPLTVQDQTRWLRRVFIEQQLVNGEWINLVYREPLRGVASLEPWDEDNEKRGRPSLLEEVYRAHGEWLEETVQTSIKAMRDQADTLAGIERAAAAQAAAQLDKLRQLVNVSTAAQNETPVDNSRITLWAWYELPVSVRDNIMVRMVNDEPDVPNKAPDAVYIWQSSVDEFATQSDVLKAVLTRAAANRAPLAALAAFVMRDEKHIWSVRVPIWFAR